MCIAWYIYMKKKIKLWKNEGNFLMAINLYLSRQWPEGLHGLCGGLKSKEKKLPVFKLSLSYSPPTLILKMLLSRLCQCAVLYSPSFMPSWWSQRFKTWKKLFFWQPTCSFTARSPKGWPPVINSHSFMQKLINQKSRTVSSWLLIGLNL